MMRRMMLVAMVFVAVIAGAEMTPMGGGWVLSVITPTLLDPGQVALILEGDSDAAMLITYTSSGSLAVAVMFTDYLASQGEQHDKGVIYATDTLGKAKAISGGWRSSTRTVVWYGEDAVGLLADIAEAYEIMFRTRDYQGSNVDAAFKTTPEDTQRALIALDAERGK